MYRRVSTSRVQGPTHSVGRTAARIVTGVATLWVIAVPPQAYTKVTSRDAAHTWGTPKDGPLENLTGGSAFLYQMHAQMYGDLEAALSGMIKERPRMPDGRWQIEAIPSVLSQDIQARGMSEDEALRDVVEWKRELPKSAQASLFEAITWTALGWAARGTTYSNGVTGAGGALFDRRLGIAAQVLADCKTSSDSNPLWYLQSLVVARSLGWPEARVRALYDEGIGKFPDFDALSRSMVTFLSPRWGGSYTKVRALIDHAVRRVPVEQKAILYTRLYEQLQETEELDASHFFKASQAQWPRMREGFRDLIRQYTASLWIHNHFAAYACAAGDRSTYVDVRQQLGTTLYETAWLAKAPTDVCDQRFGVHLFATGPMPPTHFKTLRKPALMDGPAGLSWTGYRFSYLLETKQFSELEAAIAAAATFRERLEDGSSTLYAADIGFYVYFSDVQFADIQLAALKEWHTNLPGSIAEPIVEALYWRTLAWALRQENDAKDSTPIAGKLFRERLQRAQQALQDSKGRSSSNPLWYMEELIIARGQQWKPDATRRVFDEGVGKFPMFEPLYWEMGDALSPVWGGSYAALETFANEATAKAGTPWGDTFYATTYWKIGRLNEQSFMGKSHVSWPHMRRGFDALMRQYPKSIWNANNFAIYACLAQDREAYGRIRARLGSHVIRPAWPSNVSPEVCDHTLATPL